MGNFLKLNRKFNLAVRSNTVSGRVGFSITSESTGCLADTLFTYLSNNSFKRVVIGYDASSWSKIFALEVFSRRFKELGMFHTLVDGPMPQFQLNWLVTQSKKKSFGLYLGSDCHSDNILTVTLIDESGAPVLDKQMKEILKSPGVKEVEYFQDSEALEMETVNIDLYPQYLKDSKQIAELPSQVVNVDLMFGASESLMLNLRKAFPESNIRIFNKASEPPRLLNYLPKPTGSALKWMTNFQGIQPRQYFFALDGDGDSLGVFDLTQSLELSPSSVSLLLLKHLREVAKVLEGTVVLSKALSERVSKYAKKLGFKVKTTDEGLIGLCKEVKKSKVVFYADETGGYYFTGPVARNPIAAMFRITELSTKTSLSPGQLVDLISEKEIKKTFAPNILFVSNQYTSKDALEEFLLKESKLQVKKYKPGAITNLMFDNDAKVSLKDNLLEEIIEVFIESPTPVQTLQISDLVQSYLRK